MLENNKIGIPDLFKKIKDKLFISDIIHKIEYLHYEESIYVPERVKNEYCTSDEITDFKEMIYDLEPYHISRDKSKSSNVFWSVNDCLIEYLDFDSPNRLPKPSTIK